MSSMEHSGGAKHVKKMMGMHGCPDHRRAHGGKPAAAGERAENENRPNRKMERSEERGEREDG